MHHDRGARREPFAQALVRDMLKEYPRLLGLKVYVLDEKSEPRLIASKDAAEIGTAGTQTGAKLSVILRAFKELFALYKQIKSDK